MRLGLVDAALEEVVEDLELIGIGGSRCQLVQQHLSEPTVPEVVDYDGDIALSGFIGCTGAVARQWLQWLLDHTGTPDVPAAARTGYAST